MIPIDFNARFGFRQLPFSREIAVEHRFVLPFFDEALLALRRTIDAKASAAPIEHGVRRYLIRRASQRAGDDCSLTRGRRPASATFAYRGRPGSGGPRTTRPSQTDRRPHVIR